MNIVVIIDGVGHKFLQYCRYPTLVEFRYKFLDPECDQDQYQNQMLFC